MKKSIFVDKKELKDKAENLVDILVRGNVDVMETKYQVSVKLAREPILSKPFRERERAEEVREKCIENLMDIFS